MVKFEIIVVTFNGLEYTKKAWESLKDLPKDRYGIVFVDNMSTDGTRQWLIDNELAHIPLNRNHGPAYAVNRGIEQTDSEFVIYFNNDMVLTDPDIFEHMLKVYEEYTAKGVKVGMVAPMMDYVANPYQECSKPERLPHKVIEATLIGNSPNLIPRKVLAEFNNFDEKYELYGYEDTHFCMQLLYNNYKILVDGSSWLHHDGGKGVAQLHGSTSLKDNAKRFYDYWGKRAADMQQKLHLYRKKRRRGKW